MRRRLAAGLELTSDALMQLVELVTGEVSPDSGLLAAASGETAERIGLDSGLYPHLQALYASATAAGQAIQVGEAGQARALAGGRARGRKHWGSTAGLLEGAQGPGSPWGAGGSTAAALVGAMTSI